MTSKGWLKGWGLVLCFWAAFLLVLEPGNIARAISVGHRLTLEREMARISCAALIGSAAMPSLLYLIRCYPVNTDAIRWRNLVWLALGLIALSGTINLVSCFVAAWGFQQKLLPGWSDFSRQLIGNWLLVAFALGVLSLLVRVFGHRVTPLPACPVVRHVVVKTGTRSVRVDLGEVDWIEAQGNYVALHVGSREYLHRQTLAKFSEKMDLERFIRIHRSAVVAIDCIDELRSDGDGEVTVRLRTGRELRVSKSHRRVVRERWAATNA